MGWRQDAQKAARRWGLDPHVFQRQMGLEAHGQDLTSPAGAEGPAQFIPATARSVGLNSRTVHQRGPSYDAAAKLMAGYVRKYGNYADALAAYNGGPGVVGGHLPAETRNYIATILRGGSPDPSGVRSSPGRSLSEGLSAAAAAFDPGAVLGMPPIDAGGPPQARVPSAGLQAPSFSAQAVMPQGSPGIPSGGGPAPRPTVGLPELAAQDVSFGQSAAAMRQGARVATGRGGLTAQPTSSGILNATRDWITGELGLPAGSRDRSPAHNAAVGGAADSDHIEGAPGSQHHEAEDFPTTAAQGGWGQYRKIVRKLGLTPAANGFTQGVIRAGGKKFRVQVIFGEQNDHGDHIHVGIRREA